MSEGVVYRMYDCYGDLLYVGMTTDIGNRLRKHGLGEKAFWRFVVRIEVERFPSREAAATAERVAIEREAPMYNLDPGHLKWVVSGVPGEAAAS